MLTKLFSTSYWRHLSTTKYDSNYYYRYLS